MPGVGAPFHPALHTELCTRLGIRVPLVQTGMGWVAGPRLVAATCEAGALGILASATMSLDQLAAAREVDLRLASDLGREPRAAAALDAAGHVGGDEGTQVLIRHGALALVVARDVAAETDRQVLQLALPALVADRAVERMVDEQELHGGALRADGARRPGEDLHALHDRRGAALPPWA